MQLRWSLTRHFYSIHVRFDEASILASSYWLTSVELPEMAKYGYRVKEKKKSHPAKKKKGYSQYHLRLLSLLWTFEHNMPRNPTFATAATVS